MEPIRFSPHTAYRAMRYLADKIYELDKQFDFSLPEGGEALVEYAGQLREMVEEAIRISKVPVMVPIKLPKKLRRYYKLKDEKTKKKKGRPRKKYYVEQVEEEKHGKKG